MQQQQEEEECLCETDEDSRVWSVLRVVRRYLFYTASVLYIGVCFSLLAFNSLILANNATDDSQVRAFHLTEFIAPFLYAMFVLLAIYQPLEPLYRSLRGSYSALKLRLFVFSCVEQTTIYVQCVVSLTAMLLVVYAQEDFEEKAHYLDYACLLFLSLVDGMLLAAAVSVVQQQQQQQQQNRHTTRCSLQVAQIVFSAVTLVVVVPGAIALIVMKSQGLEFETHYLEFTMEILLVLGTVVAVGLG
jgi:hypothetical protein